MVERYDYKEYRGHGVGDQLALAVVSWCGTENPGVESFKTQMVHLLYRHMCE